MTYRLGPEDCQNLETMLSKEWLLPNGIGGYAMGSAAGINTRRYHGLLVASLDPPTDRRLLLAAIEASVERGGTSKAISSNQYPGTIYPDGYRYLQAFAVDDTARWHFDTGNCQVDRTVQMIPNANAVAITYHNAGKHRFHLVLRPLVCHRDHHGNTTEDTTYPHNVELRPDSTTIEHEGVALTIEHHGASRSPVAGWYYRFEHIREQERGLDPRDDLYCPCELTYTLEPGEEARLVASTAAHPPVETPAGVVEQDGDLTGQLLEAAGKFVVHTGRRTSILAGYPWFTDWGRDTMISVPGICIATGRLKEGRQILRDTARHMRNGLIPNRFVESGGADYNTVDATLWFGNSAYKLLEAEWDEAFAREMESALTEVFEAHIAGTDFGIHVDPRDQLLSQGGSGLQLTWMDAKIGDWVVTPRHGKPVEINGLWINLLHILGWLSERLGQDGNRYAYLAEEATANFERKFWHAKRSHYLDTVDPDDATLRPNQVLALALPFSPCDPAHARRAMRVIKRELATPRGLRTLAPTEAGYMGRFEGDMRQRDAAYHQGTAWPWLLGSYATALVRHCDARNEALRVLGEAAAMLTEKGLGGIAEVYDGDAPQRPGGCPWQAWSVAEILRALIEIP